MKRKLVFFWVVVCLFTLPLSSFGQAVNATLLGTVEDSTGATVANAKVTATNVATAALFESVTNDAGNYTIPNLPPGTYSVSVVAQGFKKETHQNIDVLINTSTRVDFSVAPGSVSEEVMVTTAPPLLQTDRADISTKLETQQISNLPLTTNRNFQSLLNLVPGASPATYEHSQFFNAQGALQTRVNGMPRMGNLYQIEGIDDDERTGLLQIIIPPADSIQSVDISTNNFDAEMGRAMGGVANVILKSGSNSFHGSAFEYIQNNSVNARSYFGGPLGHLSYNNYGGSIGGPILKDKLFFFGDYQGSSDHEQISSTFTIPDARYYTPNALGNIDLSSMLSGNPNTAGFRQGQIFDPNTGDGTAGSPRAAFANNQIPISRVNPVSLDILRRVNAAAAQYGRLTPTASLLTPANNYTTNLPFTKGTNSWDTKIDYTLNERNHVSGRFSWQRVNTFQAPAFGGFLGGPAGGGFQGDGTQTSYSTGVNYDRVFSPTLFTQVRFGVAHLRNNAQPSDYGSNDATALGIPGVNIDQFSSGQVGVFLTGFGQTGQDYPLIGYSASVPWIRGESNIDFVNNWTKIIRNHTLKFGGDLRRVRDDLLQNQTFSPRGLFRFVDLQTSDSRSAGTNLANNIASFLFDRPSQVGRDVNTYFPAYRQWWFFAFATDKWQVTPKLTLDLGVRWEFYPPATPKIDGGFSNYDPVANNLVIAGVGGNPSNLGMETRYRYWAPRTGFAYRVTEDTVVRGGFGISYMPFADNNYAYNYPVRSNNAYNPSGASPYTAAVLADNTTIATFQAGFPAPIAAPIPSNGIIPVVTPALAAQQMFYVPLNYKNPYVESWNLTIQQALPYDMSLQIAYVGNHGVGIPGNIDINNPTDVYGGGNASKPEYNCVGCPPNVRRTAATQRIFQGFSSNYNSLQVQMNKRYARGLGLTTAFTWGKGMGYVINDDEGIFFFTTANLRRNYAPTNFDRTVNFEQSFTYELPVGRGHRYLNTGVGAYVLGGWKLAGVISAVTGLPFSVYANNGPLNTPGTAMLANLTGVYKVTHQVGPNNFWLDPTAFSQPAGCAGRSPCTAQNVQLGNTGRNQFRGPGYVQNNVSIFKSFPIWREAALEMRLDAFQMTNTPQFANPNSGSGNIFTSGNFGRVTSTLGSGQGSVNGVGGGRSLQASARITF
ncbi:TonB-dependent receptor [Edaphobacter aggregans]|uniref:TonB-dependent receptor n=1 Tax=Edaphobacter aggregans TaxID=570835 RepID=UPI00054EA2BC|nr:carboxypeptidase regulatory-like domain-containing protein [Edaphobacter aggregans]